MLFKLPGQEEGRMMIIFVYHRIIQY